MSILPRILVSPVLAGCRRRIGADRRSGWARRLALVVSLAGGLAAPAWAQFQIEVSGAGTGLTQYPITVAPFRGEEAAPQRPAAIIQADLLRTGQFKAVPVAGAFDDASRPDFGVFRAAGSDYAALGSVQRQGDGRFALRVHLWDATHGQDMGGQSYSIPAGDLRLASHRAADWIYERITGKKGVFASRLSYVTRANGRYTLWVSDADGEGARAALSSRASIISPTWSPDGRRLAYVSFESGKPVVYVHDVQTGQRRAVANFRGSNSAPAWSPDGSQLAVTLTRDGHSQVYVIPVAGGQPRRVSTSSGIDTEATFSPDGRSLFFVSDRGGSPQIYRAPVGGGDAQRVTFKGSYNISPSVSADGRSLAYITNAEGGYKVAVLDLASGAVTVVSNTSSDEKPSFAPNSDQIVYATRIGGRGALMTSTRDGRVKTRLTGVAGDMREPNWAPLGR